MTHSERQRNLMTHAQCPLPVYYSQTSFKGFDGPNGLCHCHSLLFFSHHGPGFESSLAQSDFCHSKVNPNMLAEKGITKISRPFGGGGGGGI